MRIKCYVVQKKLKIATEWEEANSILIAETSYTVPGLTEGEEYHFRIVAVTDAGSSPPRQVSPTVKVEEQANRPHIDLGSVQDITVRAGEDFSIVVPYKAFPKPTAAWFANDVVLDETADTRVQRWTNVPLSSSATPSARRDAGYALGHLRTMRPSSMRNGRHSAIPRRRLGPITTTLMTSP